MKKNVVKINENTFRKIVAESVKKVLKDNVQNIKQRLYYAIKNSSTYHDWRLIYYGNEVFTADLDVPLDIGRVKNCKVIGWYQDEFGKGFVTSKYQEMPVAAFDQELVVLKLTPSEMEEIIKHIIK